MKRSVRIALISLGGFIALLVLAAALLSSVIATPSRLTPLVRNVATDYVTCPMEVGEVELTFFSTFPKVGLRLNDVVLTNPVEGAPSDTLAAVRQLVACIDVMALMNENRIDVTQFELRDGRASLYVAADGRTNFDVIALPSDTAAGTTPPSLLQLKGVSLRNVGLTWRDDARRMQASVEGLSADLASDVDLTTWAGSVTLGAGMERLQFASDADSLAMAVDLQGVQAETGLTHSDGVARADELLFRVDTLVYADAAHHIGMGGIDLDLGHLQLASAALAEGRLPLAPADLQEFSTALRLKFGQLAFSDAGTPVTTALLGVSSFDLPRFCLDTAWHFEGSIDLRDIYWAVGRDVLVNHQPALVDLGFVADTAFTTFTLANTHARYARERLYLDGSVGMKDAINDLNGRVQVPSRIDVDMTFRLEETQLSRLWSLVPLYVRDEIKYMDFEGRLNLDGSASLTMFGDSIRYNAFDVRSDIRDIAVQMGDELRFKANDNYVRTVYPYGPSRRIRTGIQSSAVHVSLRDTSATADADIRGLEGTFTVSDQVLYGTAELPDMASAFTATHLDATMDDTIHVSTDGVTAQVGLGERTTAKGHKQYYRVNLNGDTLLARMGEDLQAVTGPLAVRLGLSVDPQGGASWIEWNPSVDVDVQRGVASLRQLPYPVEVPSVRLNFNLGRLLIGDSRVKLGNSDFSLSGRVDHVGDWLRQKDTLVARLDFRSGVTDVYQLMDIAEGLDPATSASPSPAVGDSAAPFIVPHGVDLELNTSIARALVGENQFDQLGGRVIIRNGKLYLEEMGFSSKAARMQLTAQYVSDDPDHLYVGGTFHLLDVEVAELLKLVPAVDTIVPMLKSFEGKAEFHITAETNLKSNYELKMSTLKAAAAVEGHDLTLLDNETFATIARYAMFSRQTRNKVDTLSVEMTVAQRQATLYPMLLKMGKYAAIISGTHELRGDMPFSYHISIADWPLPGVRPGINLSGDLENPEQISFSVGQSKYANLFRPGRQNISQQQMLEFKRRISTVLKEHVRE